MDNENKDNIETNTTTTTITTDTVTKTEASISTTTNTTPTKTKTAALGSPTNLIAGKRKRKDDEVISIQDALNDQLEEEKNLLEEANLEAEAQDWGDENVCTFDKGYFNQAVFACKTCQLSNDKLFGFCYGCSMHCHLYHDVYELFNKKDFRCDCGTKVQQSQNFKCQLTGNSSTTPLSINANEDIGSMDKKEILNEKNNYNHNFKGKYCYCDSPYDYKEDMIQCIFCEDWFHENCLKLNSNVPDIPSIGEFADLICADCLSKNQFLSLYPHIRCHIVDDQIVIDDKPNTKTTTTTTTTKNEREETAETTVECKILGIIASNKKNDLFCKENWKEELCLCKDCKQIYKDKKVEFIFDKDESKALPPPSKKEAGIPDGDKIDILKMGEDAFNRNLQPTQQRALIEGFSDMKEKLKELFAKKLDSNQVITKQDINNFFVELNVNKKLKK